MDKKKPKAKKSLRVKDLEISKDSIAEVKGGATVVGGDTYPHTHLAGVKYEC